MPGITSALAASAQNKVSLTRKERNSDCRFLTGHDIDGFAEHDWQALAKSNVVASIYMGKIEVFAGASSYAWCRSYDPADHH